MERQFLAKSFAQLSLPSQLSLEERDSVHGLGVVAKTDVKTHTQFGPLQGEAILERDIPEDFHMKDLWQVGVSPATDGILSNLHLIRLFLRVWLMF
jgi:hypothetical protein